MTYAELKTQFLIDYDFISNHMAPGIEDSEISDFLTRAQLMIVDELYKQRDITGLAELLSRQDSYLLPSANEKFGTKAYQSSTAFSDVRWVVSVKAKITRSMPVILTDEWVECDPINEVEADKWAQTSINKPIIIYPKVLERSSYYIIFIDMQTTLSTQGLQINYIQQPEPIDVTTVGTPEIHERNHRNIVTKAVQLAMKATEPQRADADVKLSKAI